MRFKQILRKKTFAIIVTVAAFWHSPDLFAQGTDAEVCKGGKGPEKFAACLRLAEAGEARAMARVSKAYLIADGTPKNDKLAASWARKSALAGDMIGQYLYGHVLIEGAGVEFNPSEARRWLEKSANAGMDEAQVAMATFFAIRDTEPNLRIARSYLEKAWANRHASAGYRLAELDIAAGEVSRNPQGIRALLEAAWKEDKKDCGKCYFIDRSVKLLAVAREFGIGGPVDIEGAKEIYQHLKKISVQGTDSRHSQADEWKKAETRQFRLPSRLTEISAQRQNELNITPLRDITPKNYVSGARRPILEFDLQVFVNPNYNWSIDAISGHIEATARAYATCDVRLGQARIWTMRDPKQERTIRQNSHAAITVFFGGPSEEFGISGISQGAFKSVEIFSTAENLNLDSRGSNNGRTILAHEIGHIFGLPHPAVLEPNLMQYGWLSHLGQAFTAKQCDQLRQHELLTSPMIAQPQSAAAPSASDSASTSTPNQKIEAAFREIQTLLVEKNQRAFSNYTAIAISMKYGISWSDAVNIITLAASWTPDRGTFSAAKHFKPDAPANVQALDPEISRESTFGNFESELTKLRQALVLELNFKILELFDSKNAVQAQIGRQLKVDESLKQGYRFVPKATTYIIGGDLITIDSGTEIVLSVQQNFLNFYARGTDAKMWVPRKLPLDPASTKEEHAKKAAQADPPTPELKSHFKKDVPATLAGGKVVSAEEVAELYKAAAQGKTAAPWVFAGDTKKIGLPNAYTLYSGAQAGTLDDDVQKKLEKRLSDNGVAKNHPIVTYCADELCWASHILSRRLIALGYTNVHWMRAGIKSWVGLGLPVTSTEYLNEKK